MKILYIIISLFGFSALSFYLLQDKITEMIENNNILKNISKTIVSTDLNPIDRTPIHIHIEDLSHNKNEPPLIIHPPPMTIKPVQPVAPMKPAPIPRPPAPVIKPAPVAPPPPPLVKPIFKPTPTVNLKPKITQPLTINQEQIVKNFLVNPANEVNNQLNNMFKNLFGNR